MSLDFAVITLKECAAKLEKSNRPETPDESFLISPVYNQQKFKHFSDTLLSPDFNNALEEKAMSENGFSMF